MKHLVQILLPMSPHSDKGKFEQLARELTRRFGGVTSFIRAPAEGRWSSDGVTELDDITVIEVMTESIDRNYWSELRKKLEQDFNQEEIVIRSQPLDLL
jgi:hypothetical protein